MPGRVVASPLGAAVQDGHKELDAILLLVDQSFETSESYMAQVYLRVFEHRLFNCSNSNRREDIYIGSVD